MITAEDREKYPPGFTDNAILDRKLVGGLTDNVLRLWLEDPVEEHPVFLALMVLIAAGGRVVFPYRLAIILTNEGVVRGLINRKRRWNILVDAL